VGEPPTAEPLEAEETLHIDTLTRCKVTEEERPPPSRSPEGRDYRNVAEPGGAASLRGGPYAAPPSAPGSPQSLTSGFRPGGLAEGASGCQQEEPPWSCSEYCTLSTLSTLSPPHSRASRDSSIRTEDVTEG